MADIVTTRIFQDGEKNITAAKLNDIVASSTIQPAFVSSKPSTSSIATTDNLLILQTAGTYAKAPFQTVIDSVNAGLSTDTEIWSVRLRSFNAIGNPTFEVDQRNVGNSLSNPTSGTFIQDRWSIGRAGTHVTSSGRVAGYVYAQGVTPGFAVSQNFFRITLTTAQAVLGATDTLSLTQSIEGPLYRELSADVHSVSLIVRSSVAGLKFGVALRDPTASKSLTKLCTIPSANTWTSIQLPSLPQMTGGTFSSAIGSVGYILNIVLACGSTYTAPANDTFQTGNFIGAVGQSNFTGSPVNSTFDVGFIQHEPGAVCSTPMDLPFTTNYDACLRYYQKTYAYGTAVGTATNIGSRSYIAPSAVNSAFGAGWFEKRMAKIPTVTLYNHATGASGSVQDGSGNNKTGAIAQVVSDSSITYINWTTAVGAAIQVYAHHTADTGW